jgi:hypothetical protein
MHRLLLESPSSHGTALSQVRLTVDLEDVMGQAPSGYEMNSEPMAAILSLGSAAGGATGGAMLGHQAVRKTVTIAVTAPAK